jgi:hypothetical protein
MQLQINFDAPTYCEIPVRGGDGTLVALIDAADKPLVDAAKANWAVHKSKGYVYGAMLVNGKYRRSDSLHRLIMGFPNDHQVDHWNLNKLDCRRHNLRLCSNGQNQANKPKAGGEYTSKFKGVDLRAINNKYRAQINRDGKCRFLGHYRTAEEAAQAYDRAAIAHFGPFARTNFPREQYALAASD